MTVCLQAQSVNITMEVCMSENNAIAGGAPPEQPARTARINEDWAATILGLVLLALALVGAIPAGLVP